MKYFDALFRIPLSMRCWNRRRLAASPPEEGRYVEIPGHGVVAVSVSLNFLGVDCLRTNLLTKKAMGLARPGEMLEIITDNTSSAETIPFMLPNYGCVYLATVYEDQRRILYVKKILT